VIYQVDFDAQPWRYLYGPLFERVLAFAVKSGIDDPLVAVKARFLQLLTRKPGVYLLVDFAPGSFTTPIAHVLGEMVNPETFYVEQLEVDDPKSAFTEELLGWGDAVLRSEHPHLQKLLISTLRDERALQRKYQFRKWRTLMIKDIPPQVMPHE